MIENKKYGFMDMIKKGLTYLFSPLGGGTQIIMGTIEDKMIKIEKRILRKIYSILVIGLGLVFIIFGIFFFLMESLGWSKTAVYLTIGITIFIVGLLLKIGESNK
ncbi:MAG: hypothetical protein Q8P57_04560 [Candidatus Pacearchaeota archaeon]|nr:hypothetical protein [Candidatus Pacearchaeota archaeon]